MSTGELEALKLVLATVRDRIHTLADTRNDEQRLHNELTWAAQFIDRATHALVNAQLIIDREAQ